MIRRWRDLRARPSKQLADDVVDLSARAATYFFALRVGSITRGVAYLMFILCGVFHPNLVVVIPVLLLAVWIHNQWQRAANFAFFGIASDHFAAFDEAAMAYLFPSRRKGQFWVLGESILSTTLSIAGLGLILVAALPLVEESDTLITPLPGLYVQHSQLPYWMLSLILLVTGALVAVAGTAVDRAVKRRAMRRETSLSGLRRGGSAVVFLRPFGVEELLVPAHQGPRRDGLAQMLPRRNEFLEDVVTWMLWARGNVLAISKPGARAGRTVGAAHHPLRRNTEWTTAVEKLLKRASTIILVPGATPGVAWEYERVRDNSELAAKAILVNSEPTSVESQFLKTVGASSEQMRHLRNGGPLPLAAVLTPHGPRLLCSSLGEDLDYEAAVEWALRHELQPLHPSRARSLARLAGQIAGTILKR
jgi:hypothetical protein